MMFVPIHHECHNEVPMLGTSSFFEKFGVYHG